MRAWRAKKKLGISDHSSTTQAFKTPQVEGKLMKKVKLALNGTPDQNKSILQSLMNDLRDVEPNSRKNGHELPAETKKEIEKFYLRDDISRASPNTKDFVTIVENGESGHAWQIGR